MGRTAEAIVARARALIGARFRPQGRGAAGLDCVGLAAAAIGVEAPRDYRLHGGPAGRIATELRRAGLRPEAAMTAGDVLVMRAGPQQLHLGIWTGGGIVHADARLRRVVERPGAPAWPVLSIWRPAVISRRMASSGDSAITANKQPGRD